MQAIILLGGKGTRLSRLFPDRPKALAPVAGTPFLQRQLVWLGQQGIRDIHLAAGHLAGAILDWVRAKQPDSYFLTPELRITCSTEPAPLGTAGGLKFAETYIHSSLFLVLNGDTLLPGLDFPALERAHRQIRPLASIAVTQIMETGRYGTIEFDSDHRISAFHEKAEHQAGWVNGGVYLMDKKIMAVVASGKNLSLERDIFPNLAMQGQLRAFPVPPPLLDMGTPEGLAAMEQALGSSPRK